MPKTRANNAVAVAICAALYLFATASAAPVVDRCSHAAAIPATSSGTISEASSHGVAGILSSAAGSIIHTSPVSCSTGTSASELSTSGLPSADEASTIATSQPRRHDSPVQRRFVSASLLPRPWRWAKRAVDPDATIAIAVGSAAGAFVLVVLVLVMVLWRRQHRHAQHSEAVRPDEAEMAETGDQYGQSAWQKKVSHHDWPWINTVDQADVDLKPRNHKEVNPRKMPLMGHALPQGGLWHAGKPAQTRTSAGQHHRRNSSVTMPLSPVSPASTRPLMQSGSWSSWPGNDFDQTMSPGHAERCSQADDAFEAELGSHAAPAEMAGSPVHRTSSFMQRARHARTRSISASSGARVTYPSQEELAQFRFGLPDRAPGTGDDESAARMHVRPDPPVASDAPQRDFVNFLDMYRLRAPSDVESDIEAQDGAVREGPWPGPSRPLGRDDH